MLLGSVIILAGGLAAVGCIYLGKVIGFGSSIESAEEFTAMISGLLSGALTSTPAFSASKATVDPSVGYGIAYIFGVIGVVLFVQLMPKITKANMEEERAKLVIKDQNAKPKKEVKLFHIDHMGIAAFSLAAIIGTFVGAIKIPLTGAGLSGTCFSLTSTGGCLLTALVMGHFGRIGKINIIPTETTLKLFRELGLVLFLVGAGVEGGVELVEQIAASPYGIMIVVYGFIAGVIMTIIPMIVGYLFARYICKLPLLNNLGSITGGMTSTPALGTLIGVAGTDDVAGAYASTYPIALVLVVLASQLINSFMLA